MKASRRLALLCACALLAACDAAAPTDPALSTRQPPELGPAFHSGDGKEVDKSRWAETVFGEGDIRPVSTRFDEFWYWASRDTVGGKVSGSFWYKYKVRNEKGKLDTYEFSGEILCFTRVGNRVRLGAKIWKTNSTKYFPKEMEMVWSVTDNGKTGYHDSTDTASELLGVTKGAAVPYCLGGLPWPESTVIWGVIAVTPETPAVPAPGPVPAPAPAP